MASLARLKPNNPRVAERCELFIGGLELANGYSELINQKEQALRSVMKLSKSSRNRVELHQCLINF